MRILILLIMIIIVVFVIIPLFTISCVCKLTWNNIKKSYIILFTRK